MPTPKRAEVHWIINYYPVDFRSFGNIGADCSLLAMAGTIEIPAFGCDEDDPSVVLARLRDYMQANHASLLDDCNFDDLEETGGAAAAEGEIESDFLFRTEYPVQELKRTEEKILRCKFNFCCRGIASYLNLSIMHLDSQV